MTDVQGGCTASTVGALNNGDQATYSFIGCSHGSTGSRLKTDIQIAYNTTTGLSHTKTGTVTARLE